VLLAGCVSKLFLVSVTEQNQFVSATPFVMVGGALCLGRARPTRRCAVL
jgi:hypothetical protein